MLRNVDGEEFLSRYSPKGSRATRDLMARAVKQEIDEGRGNPRYVFADCSGIPGEVLKLRYGELSAILSRYGLNLAKDLLQIAPSAHFYLGGVVIDRTCATSVEGLFACGEAAGGLHGANRLAGIALAEAAVFGSIAGRSASEYFKRQPPLPSSGISGEIPSGGAKASLSGLTERLREGMWSFASIVRSEVSLQKAGREIDEISRELESGGAGNSGDLPRLFSLRSMLLTARMLVECSLLRKETRGAFCREEYRDSSREYAGSFLVQKTENGTMAVRFRPNCHELSGAQAFFLAPGFQEGNGPAFSPQPQGEFHACFLQGGNELPDHLFGETGRRTGKGHACRGLRRCVKNRDRH